MIIDLPSNLRAAHGRPFRMGFFHFSNNNLSIRRQCAREVGMYAPEAIKSEDVELCFRVALSPQWVACREDDAAVRHKGRRTFSELVRQMWGWGFYVGYPYAKTGIRGVYLYWVSAAGHKLTRQLEAASFPLLVCVFATEFHLMHGLAAAALLATWSGHMALAAVMAAGVVWALRAYLHDVVRAGLSPWDTLKLGAVHYVTNVAFTTATFLGGLRHRIVLVPASILRPDGPTPR